MTKKSETPKPASQAQTQSGQLMIQKVYTKDLSFETPHSPQIFSEDWKPTVNLQLANHATTHGNDLYEVVLTVTVTVTFAEKTVYLAEVNQAGIFQVSGFPENLKARVLATMCPNILYPFAREMVSDLVTRGGFPQLLLAPVNFEALYAEQARQQSGDAANPPATKH